MQKIIHYEVLSSRSTIDLINKVNNMIQKGYQPYGQYVVSVVGTYNQSCHYYQPMVKYEI